MSDSFTSNPAESRETYGGEGRAANLAQAGTAVADSAAEAAQHAAEQSRETILQGLRALAGAQAPLADLSYEGSRRLAEATAAVTNIYRSGADKTIDDIQALTSAYLSIGRGFQQYQHTYLELVSRSMENTASKWRSLSRATSVVGSAEIQRDIYLESVNGLLTGSTTLLQLLSQLIQDAVRPLQERTAHKQSAGVNP